MRASSVLILESGYGLRGPQRGNLSLRFYVRHGTENETVAPGPSFRTAHRRP